MRYLVRADFDTLFIGEIRDAATAAAAVRMAKAGRRVISTIHATDNVTAMLRLIELSDDSALSVLDAVSGVISQRLVRKIDPESGGYDGRHPIHEVLFINNEFTDKLIENKSLGEIRLAAEATSTTFADNLRELVEAGITDNYESRRVIGHDV
jgi:type II secretory ATPase GspE/PulE/Tfp pilus assembly ATPase PilB-like protein